MTKTRAQRREGILALVYAHSSWAENSLTALNLKLKSAERECANLRELNGALQECCNRKARIEKRLCEALDENDRLRAELKALKGERR